MQLLPSSCSQWRKVRGRFRNLIKQCFGDGIVELFAGRDNDTVELGSLVVPACSQYAPVVLVVSALKDYETDFYTRNSTVWDKSWGFPDIKLSDRLIKQLRPVAANSIDAPNLLFNDRRIPLWMKQYHGAAGMVQIQTFPADP